MDNGTGDQEILDSKAADVSSIPFTSPFIMVAVSKHVTNTNPVKVQITTVSMKGSSKATKPSVSGESVFTAEWAIAESQ